jgi:hypothetical protein
MRLRDAYALMEEGYNNSPVQGIREFLRYMRFVPIPGNPTLNGIRAIQVISGGSNLCLTLDGSDMVREKAYSLVDHLRGNQSLGLGGFRDQKIAQSMLDNQTIRLGTFEVDEWYGLHIFSVYSPNSSILEADVYTQGELKIKLTSTKESNHHPKQKPDLLIPSTALQGRSALAKLRQIPEEKRQKVIDNLLDQFQKN